MKVFQLLVSTTFRDANPANARPFGLANSGVSRFLVITLGGARVLVVSSSSVPAYGTRGSISVAVFAIRSLVHERLLLRTTYNVTVVTEIAVTRTVIRLFCFRAERGSRALVSTAVRYVCTSTVRGIGARATFDVAGSKGRLLIMSDTGERTFVAEINCGWILTCLWSFMRAL